MYEQEQVLVRRKKKHTHVHLTKYIATNFWSNFRIPFSPAVVLPTTDSWSPRAQPLAVSLVNYEPAGAKRARADLAATKY